TGVQTCALPIFRRRNSAGTDCVWFVLPPRLAAIQSRAPCHGRGSSPRATPQTSLDFRLFATPEFLARAVSIAAACPATGNFGAGLSPVAWKSPADNTRIPTPFRGKPRAFSPQCRSAHTTMLPAQPLLHGRARDRPVDRWPRKPTHARRCRVHRTKNRRCSPRSRRLAPAAGLACLVIEKARRQKR